MKTPKYRYEIPMRDVLAFLHSIGVPYHTKEVELHMGIDSMTVEAEGHLTDLDGKKWLVGEVDQYWVTDEEGNEYLPYPEPTPAIYHEKYKVKLVRYGYADYLVQESKKKG
jgi:hypothetical protein